MGIINTTEELKEAILLLENERTLKAGVLKQQLSAVYESVKPINLIKNTFKQVTGSQEIKNGFVNTALGMGAGYLAKLLFQTMAKSPFAKIAGTVLQFGISNAAMNHPEMIEAAEENILQLFRKK